MSKIELIFRENMNDYISKVKEQFPDAKFYSHSRLGNYNQCQRGYYYTYIDKKPQKTGVYSTLGTACHTTLEDLYENKTTTLSKKVFDDEFLKCELFGINFPRSKYDIKGGYYKDISAFYESYKKITIEGAKYISELGFILKIDDNHYLQGYIDLLILHPDGTAEIIDFKTSSTFDKAHTLEAGRQLVLYKMAIEQLYGIEVRSVSWEMLKYIDVKVGTNKIKTAIKGREYVAKCSSQIKTLMKKAGYDDFLIESYLLKAEEENSFSCLPKEIQNQIEFNVHRRYYDVTDELKDELIEYIKSTIKEIENKKDEPESCWCCKVDQFFCENLCSFSNTYCQYKEMIEK